MTSRRATACSRVRCARKLTSDGVSRRSTLIDQIRTQLGWTQVLREELGDKTTITDAEVADQQRLSAQQVGKPEYRVGEIFIPVEDPANQADAQRSRRNGDR